MEYHSIIAASDELHQPIIKELTTHIRQKAEGRCRKMRSPATDVLIVQADSQESGQGAILVSSALTRCVSIDLTSHESLKCSPVSK